MPRLSLVGLGLLLTVIVEIVLFVLVAHWLGVGLTVLLVLATSLLGAWLVRSAGLLSGLLLVLPGFLTDAVGLALLAPPVQRVAGRGVQRFAERRISSSAAGNLFGPRRVRVRRGEAYRPTPEGPPPPGGAPIEGEIVDG